MTNLPTSPSSSRTYPPSNGNSQRITNIQAPPRGVPPLRISTDPAPAPKSEYPTCSYIKPNGSFCQCPALTGSEHCYHHQRDKLRKRNVLQATSLKRSTQLKPTLEDFDSRVLESLDLPPLDDAAAIQVSLSNIMRALVSGHISMRRAGLILYCLQTAAANLKAYNAQLAADAELATADPHPIAPLLAVTPPPTAERQDGEPLKDAPAPPHARIPASVPQRDDVVHKIAAHAAREHAPVPAAAHSG